MSSQAPNNAVEEDYQLWDPREREDTRLGKKFVVRSSKQIIYIEEVVLISVCRGCIRSRRRGLHGQEFQEQAKRHETVRIPDSHTSARSRNGDR